MAGRVDCAVSPAGFLRQWRDLVGCAVSPTDRAGNGGPGGLRGEPHGVAPAMAGPGGLRGEPHGIAPAMAGPRGLRGEPHGVAPAMAGPGGLRGEPHGFAPAAPHEMMPGFPEELCRTRRAHGAGMARRIRAAGGLSDAGAELPARDAAIRPAAGRQSRPDDAAASPAMMAAARHQR